MNIEDLKCFGISGGQLFIDKTHPQSTSILPRVSVGWIDEEVDNKVFLQVFNDIEKHQFEQSLRLK